MSEFKITEYIFHPITSAFIPPLFSVALSHLIIDRSLRRPPLMDEHQDVQTMLAAWEDELRKVPEDPTARLRWARKKEETLV